jgi:hypothetical protein
MRRASRLMLTSCRATAMKRAARLMLTCCGATAASLAGRFVFRLGLLAALTSLLLLASACSRSGALVLAFSTDMEVPKDFDHLVVKVTAGAQTVLHRSYTYGSENGEAPSGTGGQPDCEAPAGNAPLELPLVLTVLPDWSRQQDVSIQAWACTSDNEPLLERTIHSTVPTDRVAMLRVPLQWLCAQHGGSTELSCDEGKCIDCSSDQHNDTQDCSARSDDATCIACLCGVSTVAVATLPDYDPQSVFGEAGYPQDHGPCFDTLGCFDRLEGPQFSADPEADDRVQLAVTMDAESCTAEPDPASGVTRTSLLNVALVLPAYDGQGNQGKGICGRDWCLVPLEFRPRSDTSKLTGWTWWGPSDQDSTTIRLAYGVCEALRSGDALFVEATKKSGPDCARKTRALPICGPWSSVGTPRGTFRQQRSAPAAGLPQPVARWRLDDCKEDTEWRTTACEDGNGDACEDAELELGAGDHAPACADTCVGGAGHAAWFAGQQYAQAELESVSALDSATAFTISAWISLAEDSWPCGASSAPAEAWPVVSISDAQNPVHELGIRRRMPADWDQAAWVDARCEPADWELLFSCATDSSTQELTLPLPPTRWKAGNWYHVAASFQQHEIWPEAEVRLFWEGQGAAPQFIQHPVSPSSVTGLTVGMNALVAEDTVQTGDGFRGYIDDIALFATALDDAQLWQYYIETHSFAGPSGYHWRAWDSDPHGPGQPDGNANLTVTTWEDPASVDAPLQVNIGDGECSNGGVEALVGQAYRLGSPSARRTADLGRFNQAVFVADIEPPGRFQFLLSGEHGRYQCAWELDGQDEGGACPYVVELERPSWCTDPDCTFDFAFENAVVGSVWEKGSAEQGDVNMQVSALAFREFHDLPSDGTDMAGGNRGGIGPGGLCWRPVSYSPGPAAAARLHDSVSEGLLSAQLPREPTGEGAIYVGVAADWLGEAPLDLSGCEAIRLRADLPSGLRFQFQLKDENGAILSKELDEDDGSWFYTVTIGELDPLQWECGGLLPDFDLKRVRSIEIQKDYTSREAAEVQISAIEFIGDGDADTPCPNVGP